MEQRTMIHDMTSGPLGKQILLYSAPMMLANLLQTLYNLVDLAVVGRCCFNMVSVNGQMVKQAATEVLSAVSISGQITFLLYALGIGLGSGCQILISQQIGAKDLDAVRRTTGTTLTATIVLAAVVLAVGLIFKNGALQLLNTPTESMEDAKQYMFWCCLGIPFTYGYGSLCSVLRGMGDSRRPMYIIAVAAVTNMALDLILVWGLGMRAKGAGIATASAQLMSFLFALFYLYRHRDSFGFDFKRESFKVDRPILRTVVRLAVPLAFQQIAVNVSMLFVNAWVNAYGVVASAVGGIGSKLYGVASIVTNAMQTSEATVTGQNLAAHKLDRVRRSVYVSALICIGYWVVLSAICLFFPEGVFGLFTTDPEVLALSGRYMLTLVTMYLAFTLMAPALGFISGVGNMRYNFIVALLDSVAARIGLSLLLAVPLGLFGYWWGTALAGFVSVVMGWAYFFSGRWEKRKLLTE